VTKPAVFVSAAVVLARQGCSSILYLYDRLTYSGQQKLQGFRDGLKKAGLKEDPQLMLMVDRTLDAAQNVVERLLRKKYILTPSWLRKIS
jgi:LacI family transcriptional regulator